MHLNNGKLCVWSLTLGIVCALATAQVTAPALGWFDRKFPPPPLEAHAHTTYI